MYGGIVGSDITCAYQIAIDSYVAKINVAPGVHRHHFVHNGHVDCRKQIASVVGPPYKSSAFLSGVIPQGFATILAVVVGQGCVVGATTHADDRVLDIEFGDIDVSDITIYHKIALNIGVANHRKIAHHTECTSAIGYGGGNVTVGVLKNCHCGCPFVVYLAVAKTLSQGPRQNWATVKILPQQLWQFRILGKIPHDQIWLPATLSAAPSCPRKWVLNFWVCKILCQHTHC